jgi:hypothetical protein
MLLEAKREILVKHVEIVEFIELNGIDFAQCYGVTSSLSGELK